MKKVSVTLSLLTAAWMGLACTEASAQVDFVQGKATYHEFDNAHAESVRDTYKHELTEMTYNAMGVVVSQTRFQLNAAGMPTQGVIMDGAENLIGRVQFYFDDLGRTIEQRMLNPEGQVFQRVIQQYDPAGQPLKPLMYNYDVRRPAMKTKPVDMTKPLRGANVSPGAANRPPPVQAYSRSVPQAGIPRATVVGPPPSSGAPGAGRQPLQILTVSPQTGTASVDSPQR